MGNGPVFFTGFQCRTRLCGWCNIIERMIVGIDTGSFNAARGFVGGATFNGLDMEFGEICFNAARGFVGGATRERTKSLHL